MPGGAVTAKATKKKKKSKKAKVEGQPPKPWTGDENDSVTEHEDSENDEDYSDTNEERAKEYRKGGYHPVRVGELYNNGRYRIVHKLGWGYFSTVWLAWDYDKTIPDPCPKLDHRCRTDPETLKLYTGEPRVRDNLADPTLREAVSPTALLSDDGFAGSGAKSQLDFGGRTRGGWAAIKFQKSATHYSEAAHDEIRLLSQLSRTALDKHNSASAEISDWELMAPCCRLYDHFQHAGPHGLHYCMVFDVLGENLLQPIIGTNYRGLAGAWKDGVGIVKRMSAQLLRALDHAHRVAGVLHTDVKPENILFVAPPPSVQKIIREFDPPNHRNSGNRLEERPAGELSATQMKKLAKKVKEGKLSAARYSEIKAEKERVQQGGAATAAAAAAVAPEDTEDVIAAEAAIEASRPPRLVAGADPSAKDALTAENAACFVLSRGEAVKEGGTEQYAEGHRPAHVINGAIAVADFGNACWVDQQYTEEVQTRQYRAPEVIIGAGYGSAIDVWSVACVIFELLTGEFLFEPKGPADGGTHYTRDDDHLALIIELVGPFPPHMSRRNARPLPQQPLAYWLRESNVEDGPYPYVPKQGPQAIREAEGATLPADMLAARTTDAPKHGGSPHGTLVPRDRSKFFDDHGNLAHISGLKNWSLFDVLTDKYNFTPNAAREITSFLIPMLHPDPRCRPSAGQMLRHPWLCVRSGDLDGTAKGPGRSRDPAVPPPQLDRTVLPWWADVDWTREARMAYVEPQPSMPAPFVLQDALLNPAWCDEFFRRVTARARELKLRDPKAPDPVTGLYMQRTAETLSAVYGVSLQSVTIPQPEVGTWESFELGPQLGYGGHGPAAQEFAHDRDQPQWHDDEDVGDDEDLEEDDGVDPNHVDLEGDGLEDGEDLDLDDIELEAADALPADTPDEDLESTPADAAEAPVTAEAPESDKASSAADAEEQTSPADATA